MAKVSATRGKSVVTGLDDIIKRLRFTRKEHAKGIERGLRKAGQSLYQWSQELVPIDTGALKSSGGWSQTGEGYQTEIIVGYFGIHYAIYVHEDLNKFHPVGQAKFLEQPARERRRELAEIVRNEVRRNK